MPRGELTETIEIVITFLILLVFIAWFSYLFNAQTAYIYTLETYTPRNLFETGTLQPLTLFL